MPHGSGGGGGIRFPPTPSGPLEDEPISRYQTQTDAEDRWRYRAGLALEKNVPECIFLHPAEVLMTQQKAY